MSIEKLFEAFFWIEPTRANLNEPFAGTKIVWHSPEDVTAVASDFKHIPDFCFPGTFTIKIKIKLILLIYYYIFYKIDIEKISLEKGESAKLEHFVFTLTDKNNDRTYGICLRGLFRGEGRRFDVKRRARHCLCFVTKLPHFSLFRTLLSQIYAVTLLEKKFGSAKRILEALYEKRSFNIGSSSYLIDMNKILYSAEFLGSLPKSLLLANSSFSLQLPSTGEFAYRQDSCILPLLEVLGVERFLLILTATLLEHRIIFIADEAETLSSSLLAVSSMIYPFSWRSFFAPLLPSRLLEMTGAPYP